MEISQHMRAILSFVEAANSESFSSAARKLAISSAAVSKNVAGLEQALGVRLMNRTTRKVSLTEEGAAFLSQARIALEALENAVESVAATRQEISGHVRISTSSGFGRGLLLPALPGLFEQYPRLQVEADFDDRVVDLVRDGYDIAIRGGRIVDSTLITRPICRLNTVLVASPSYLKRRGAPRHPDELVQHQLIGRRFLGGRMNTWGFSDSNGSVTVFEPSHAAVTLSAPEAVVQAAVDGLGIGQVGVHDALPFLQQGLLHVVLLDQHDQGNYEMVIQYPHRSLIAPRVKATVEYLLETFAQDPTLHTPVDELAQYKFHSIK